MLVGKVVVLCLQWRLPGGIATRIMTRKLANVGVSRLNSDGNVGCCLSSRAPGCVQDGVIHNLSFPVHAETPRDTAHTCELHILHGLILRQLPCKAAVASDKENRRRLANGRSFLSGLLCLGDV